MSTPNSSISMLHRHNGSLFSTKAIHSRDCDFQGTAMRTLDFASSFAFQPASRAIEIVRRLVTDTAKSGSAVALAGRL